MLSFLQVSILTAVAALVAFTVISILPACWTVNPVDKAWKQLTDILLDFAQKYSHACSRRFAMAQEVCVRAIYSNFATKKAVFVVQENHKDSIIFISE